MKLKKCFQYLVILAHCVEYCATAEARIKTGREIFSKTTQIENRGPASNVLVKKDKLAKEKFSKSSLPAMGHSGVGEKK